MVAEITNSVAADGQTPMTAPLKAANGTVLLPALTFASDLDSGVYRIGANNIGVAVNGAKVLDVGTAGLAITGTFTATGAVSAPAGTLGFDGTVSLPSYSFTSDTDSGIYRIGANNLGVAVNGAKVLDIGTGGLTVTGTLTGALAGASLAAGDVINATIAESNGSSAVTFALKTLAGTDPSATDPVVLCFRNATVGTGNYVYRTVTAALSLVVSSGSTLGFSSGIAGKLWLVLFDDAGTIRLGVINCLSGTNIYPLGQNPIASSTAEGGSGAADSAQVFYTGAAVTSKPYLILGSCTYESGIATAGSWNASPTRIRLFGSGVPLPGAEVQVQENYTGAVATGTTGTPFDDTIPQNNEGNQFMTQAITPTSAANLLRVMHKGIYGTSGTAVTMIIGLYQDSTANALVAGSQSYSGASDVYEFALRWSLLAGTTSATTFKIRVGDASASTITFNGAGAARKLGGVMGSFLSVLEIVT